MAVESGVAPGSEAKAVGVGAEGQTEGRKEPVLAPAPLPTKSPWKAVSGEIPVSSISVESGKKKKKNKAGTPAISSSTKWVPMKASIVVSAPKRAGNGARKGNNKNTGAAGSKKKKQSQQPRKQSPRSSGDEETKDESKEVEQQDVANSKTDVQSEGSTVGELQPSAGQGGRQTYQRRKHNHSNQFQHSAHQQTGFQRRRYHSNYNNDPSRQQRYMHSKGMSPYQGRVPHPLGHDPHLISGHMQKAPYVVPMYQQYYSMQPILMAVNSIARQIEYYFSPENLAQDKYLRSKLSKEGYAPLSLIAKFYRIVNMSFGGDPSLILAALREIVYNQNSTVDVCYGTMESADDAGSNQEDHAILANYFVRSKQWEASLPDEFSTVVKIEKILENDALDEFMITAASMQTKIPSTEPQQPLPVGAISEKSEEESEPTSTAEDPQVKAQ